MREQPAAEWRHQGHLRRPLRRNRNVACRHYLRRSAVAGVGCRVGCSGCRAGCRVGCRRQGVFARPRAAELEVARRVTTRRPALRRHGKSCGELVGEIQSCGQLVREIVGEIVGEIGEISLELPLLVG